MCYGEIQRNSMQILRLSGRVSERARSISHRVLPEVRQIRATSEDEAPKQEERQDRKREEEVAR